MSRRTWWPFITGLVVGAAAVCAIAEVVYRKRQRDAQLRLVRQNVNVTDDGVTFTDHDLSADRAGWL